MVDYLDEVEDLMELYSTLNENFLLIRCLMIPSMKL